MTEKWVNILGKMSYRTAKRLCAWGVLIVALLTYLLTLEPTASYWDCPEYISVAYGLQPGHPPGNPMWMLVARFFINFAPSTEYVALSVNVMSAVCSALTILLLFLTLEFFASRLLHSASRSAHALCIGASATGALAFCWSDSFWFSAVEAEVYAFSSLCTALLFWLSLVWYKHRHEPHSDRYLILLAYLTGVTLGVHELNLLCLPALLLVVAYGYKERLKWWQVVCVLFLGLVAIAAVLYGIIPGFIALAKVMELWCVNTLGMRFNSGLLITWISVLVLLGGTSLYLHYIKWRHKRLLRICRLAVWSVLMVFIGFSCYAVVIIRAAANPTLDTGHPADIFAFEAYFNRDQYGTAPLIYGAPFTAPTQRQRTINANGDTTYSRYALKKRNPIYVRGMEGMPPIASGVFHNSKDSAENARLHARGKDWYRINSYGFEKKYPPELDMWFPRLHSHSGSDITGYYNWLNCTDEDMYHPDKVTMAVDENGNPVNVPPNKIPGTDMLVRPTYMQNFQFFIVYQCAYMYWRYFLWNFVGRQNDYTGHGEPDAGNFITGIDAIDCLMLDVSADAPANAGKENKGRNVYFALPLILGIIGLIYQIRQGRPGRRQALVITMLFLLTGMAIVVYLNQGPVQARDRDYAFLGSWYAFCIWIGVGTLGLYSMLCRLLKRHNRTAVIISIILALCVPLQMLSQTYDDHDRSGRTVARDMPYNMLVSVEPQAIIFTSQDNNIFPLWYMTEVEGIRPDVRIISTPYISLTWYPTQWAMPVRDSKPIEMTAPTSLLCTDILNYVRLGSDSTWTPAVQALRTLYTDGIRDFTASSQSDYPILKTPRVFFTMGNDTIRINLSTDRDGLSYSLLDYYSLIMLDILATNASSENPRPIYWTHPLDTELFHGQLEPYMEEIGTLSRLNPASPGFNARRTAQLALNEYRYGTSPGVLESGRIPYFDPVSAHKMAALRTSLLKSADKLSESNNAEDSRIALALLEKIEKMIPEKMIPYEAFDIEPIKAGRVRIPRYEDEGLLTAKIYLKLATTLADPGLKTKGEELQQRRTRELHDIKKYRNSLRPSYRPFVTYRLEHMLYVLDPPPIPDSLRDSHNMLPDIKHVK